MIFFTLKDFCFFNFSKYLFHLCIKRLNRFRIKLYSFRIFGVSFAFSLISKDIFSGFSAGFCANTSLCRGDCERVASHVLQLEDTIIDYDVLYDLSRSDITATYVV